MITHLCSPEEFERGEITVEGDAYRHLFRARRLAVGDELRVVDGAGRARAGKVERIDRRAATLALGEAVASREPSFAVELWVPTLRPERAAWLVEKATEVGVLALRFYQSERAPREFGAGSRDRLHRVAAAAVEQCHRARVPAISGPHAWESISTEASRPRFVLLPNAPRGAFRALAASHQRAGAGADRADLPAGAALILGPEGGFAPPEEADLARSGWHPAGLGERVLRAETAAVVGAALLLDAGEAAGSNPLRGGGGVSGISLA